MTLSRWYIAKGSVDARRFLASIQPDGMSTWANGLISMLPVWSDDKDKAARFESHDVAVAFALMLAGQGTEVMTITWDAKAEQQAEAQRMHKLDGLASAN